MVISISIKEMSCSCGKRWIQALLNGDYSIDSWVCITTENWSFNNCLLFKHNEKNPEVWKIDVCQMNYPNMQLAINTMPFIAC